MIFENCYLSLSFYRQPELTGNQNFDGFNVTLGCIELYNIVTVHKLKINKNIINKMKLRE